MFQFEQIEEKRLFQNVPRFPVRIERLDGDDSGVSIAAQIEDAPEKIAPVIVILGLIRIEFP